MQAVSQKIFPYRNLCFLSSPHQWTSSHDSSACHMLAQNQSSCLHWQHAAIYLPMDAKDWAVPYYHATIHHVIQENGDIIQRKYWKYSTASLLQKRHQHNSISHNHFQAFYQLQYTAAKWHLSRWYGIRWHWINSSLPQYIAIDRKPENGCEI